MACSIVRTSFSLPLRVCLNRYISCRCYQPSRMLAEKATSSVLEPGAPSPLPSDSKVLSKKIERLVDEITSLTLLEVADLNYALKKKLNIPDIPIAAATGFAINAGQSAAGFLYCQLFKLTVESLMNFSAASTANTEAADEETAKPALKSSFSLKLTKFDESKKIALIKEIRNAISGLNLVQAKKFVDSVPAVVKEDLSKQEADELKEKLEKAGASCEIV
uniref:Ribosomal protein L7/L12 n=1 Tax=Syphacia muris TaxID=451379 RepID=A0A0N5ANI4_9BILA